jgi:tetratricopeptide (TPR) repeat protein
VADPGSAVAAYALTVCATVAALTFALGTRVTAPTGQATDRRATPWRLVAGLVVFVLAGVVSWRYALRPVRADALVVASLAAGARGDLPGAVAAAEEAAALWPEQPALGGYLAAAHRAVMVDPARAIDVRESGYRRAVEALESAMARAPSSDLAAKLGDLHRDRGDWATDGPEQDAAWRAAIEWYERSLDAQPAFPGALEAYASTLERLGEAEGAAALYERALAIDHARHSARAGLVRALLARGDVKRAAAQLQIGIAIDPAGAGAALDAAEGTRVNRLAVLQSRYLYAALTTPPFAHDAESDQMIADLDRLELQLRDAGPDDATTASLIEFVAARQPN